MAEQPGSERGREEPRTDLPPRKQPYYDGTFGSEEEQGAERTAEEHEDAPARRQDPGGIGEGPL